ncbi:hypothetical protein VP496E541_P0015 [Vibrio phage 496E54-1]|nr:hypothetical protein VP495E541_P0015 [Vibrio phage 495E54-1]CAH9011818.1 hypothetical protein VP496E541_P0015 [Vibrio phage 496E54-1]
MAIVYLDKIKSGIPTTIIEGKDVDSVIIIDPDPAMPPFFLANRMSLNSTTKTVTVYDGSGVSSSTFNIDASSVEALVQALESEVNDTNDLAQSAHNLAVSAQTEAAINTAAIAATDVTVAIHGDKLAVHRAELTVLSGDMVTVKQSARAANLTADEALAKANINTEGIANLDLETTDLFNGFADHELRILSNTAKADASIEQLGENELKIATLETDVVGIFSDVERIDAEIAAIEAETVLRNNTNIHVKDVSTSTGTFKLDDPNRVIDKYDFSINGTSELTFTGDSVDFYTKPLTNVGTGGELDTNAANIGDVKRIAANTNPDLANYVEKMSDAPLNSVEMEFAAIGSTADEGLILEGDTLYAKSSAGYQHFFIEDGKFNVKSKLIQNVRPAVDTGDAVNKGQLDTVDTKATAADTLSKSNQADLTNLGQTVGENTAQIGANTSAIASKADQAELATVKATANEADALSKTNKARLDTNDTTISDIEADITAVTNRVSSNETGIENLSTTVGGNVAAISSLNSTVGTLSGEIDAVSDVASQADTLAKSNQSAITGLNSAVDNNTNAISANATEIANVKTTANTADTLSKSNQATLATKASQEDLDTVAGVANAADSRSQFNEAKLEGKISTDSDAEVNSLVNVSGNYNSTDNFDLSVNGTNVLSATQSAIYAKKNMVFQGNNALIKGLSDAVEDEDAMNKQSVEVLTNALSTRIDNIAAGTGDESDFVTVDGFDKMLTENGVNLLDRLNELDGDSQCHIAFNEIRAARPLANPSQNRWVMYEFVDANNPIWKFAPKTGIPLKDGLVSVEHTSDVGVSLRIVTESTILVKTIHYNFGTGNNGRRNDWQVWQPKVKGWEGFNKGQILTDEDISWVTSSNLRTNMQRLRDAIPNGCIFIGWHNHKATDNKYKIIAKGNTDNIEGTAGTYILWKHGGPSSTTGFYINSASTEVEGWTRTYLGTVNAWVSFGKQDNRSTGTFFSGVESVTIPHNEDREDLKTLIVDTTQNLSTTSLTDADGTYNSVGKYGVGWDGNWTQEWAYHNTYLNSITNVYIAFDYSVMQWRKFPVSKSHTQIDQPAVQSTIALLGGRGLFPADLSITVNLGDVEAVPHVNAEVEEVYNHETKESTLTFGGGKMWGYVLGGGVPDSTPPEYPDGIHPDDGGDV